MSDTRLQGKAAMVTGAADGVGHGVATRFTRAGAGVVVADVNVERGEQVVKELNAEGGKAVFQLCDVTQKAQVLAAIERAKSEFGSIDILVNNAYKGRGLSRVQKTTDEEAQESMNMTFFAAKWSMEAAFPTMKANKWGRVINIASLNSVNAHMGSVAMNASKEALRAYTRTAAREWAPHQICCNIICPAAVSAAFRYVRTIQPEMIAASEKANPMGRIGDCIEDIGGVAVFLASEDARYVTGNTLFVDGGSHINGAAWSPDLGED